MFVEIYGRTGCAYCTRARELGLKLKDTVPHFDFRYIDIITAGITKDDLTKLVGKPVQTVPQVFIDGKPVGGCTDFQALMKEQFGVSE